MDMDISGMFYKCCVRVCIYNIQNIYFMNNKITSRDKKSDPLEGYHS